MMRYIALLLLAVSFSFVPFQALAESKNLAVLELFTSQGCADTPPADALLDDLAEENDTGLIILSCHVTYFDKYGWEDSLAKEFCDNRHAHYLFGLGILGLKTPQAVVNGRYEVDGKKDTLLRSAVKMAQSIRQIEPVAMTINGDQLDISLPETALSKATNITIFAYDKLHQVDIKAGANEGRNVKYVNSIRHMSKPVPWDGKEKSMSVSLKDMPGDGYAVIAQYEDYTDIVAAGKVEILQSKPREVKLR